MRSTKGVREVILSDKITKVLVIFPTARTFLLHSRPAPSLVMVPLLSVRDPRQLLAQPHSCSQMTLSHRTNGAVGFVKTSDPVRSGTIHSCDVRPLGYISGTGPNRTLKEWFHSLYLLDVYMDQAQICKRENLSWSKFQSRLVSI